MNYKWESEADRNEKKFKTIASVAILAVVGLIIMTIVKSIGSNAAGAKPHIDAVAAYLIDANTGKVLFAKNENSALAPASMSKMMTELLVLEAIDKGHLKWNDLVVMSAYAANIPGSAIGVTAGNSYTVRELFEALAIHSANDAAVALAEQISGSETAFVQQMNERARRLGLSASSIFGNASGLHSNDLQTFEQAAKQENTMLSAKDTAQLAGYLIRKYPEILDITSKRSFGISGKPEPLTATNLMLPGGEYEYSGTDGFKTGYTLEAGYCFVGTAMQDGQRMISVVMGAETSKQRFLETQKLLHFGLKR